MSLKIDRVQLEIVIQQDSARQKMMQLEDKMKSIRKELRGLKEGTDEYIAKNDELKAAQKQYDALFDKIGIGALSVNELRKRQQELNTILKQLPGNSSLYSQYSKQLEQINARLNELKVTSQQTHFSLSKLADGFNRYAAIGASAIASLTGISLAVRKSVDEFAKLEESEADVRKYTGMTREQVKDLNEEFKNMNTRTARTELNDLASDAGRLGIKSKKELLDFASAGDVIRVSLGEDLGKDAIKNIGKLSQMFGDADKMGLKQAMLSVGSAVNEVAQNSSSAEPYLVDFTARLAGVGNQANMSISQIIGYASVLDQNMQQVEMASTALQGIMMKMFKDPSKLATIAGMEIKSFTELVKKDANEALLQLLDTLGKAGGMNELAPMFDEMKLDGARAASVLSVLAGNIDQVRNEQELASTAFKDGTSVVNEFDVKNNTLQASIDKNIKKFKEINYELGEKLSPYMGNVITGAGTLVRALVAVVSIMIKYSGTITSVCIAIGLYVVAMKGAVVLDKLKVFWSEKVIMALRSMYMVMKSHPYLAIASVILIYLGYLKDTNKELTEAERREKLLGEIRKDAAKNIRSEKSEVEQMLAIARNENTSKGERLAAIRRLNEISPEYLGSLTLEKINTEEATKAVSDYIDKLLIKQEIEAAIAKKTKLQDEIDDIVENDGIDEAWYEYLWNGFLNGTAKGVNSAKKLLTGFEDEWATKTMDNLAHQGSNKIKELDAQAKVLDDFIEESRKKLIKIEVGGNKVDADGMTEEERKALAQMQDKERKKLLQQEEKKLKSDYEAEQNKAKKKFLDNDKKTEEEYQSELYKAEIVYLTKRVALLQDFKEDASEVQGQIFDKMIAEADRLDKAQKDAEKKKKDKEKKEKTSSFTTLDSTYQEDQALITQQYLEGQIKTEKEFQKKMKELEADYLNTRKKMLEGYGDDVSKINKQIQDNQLDQKKEEKEEKKDQGFKDIDKTFSESDKLDKLKEMYDADLINYEEYEKKKSEISKDCSKTREDIASATFQILGQAAGAASDVVQAMQERETSKVTRAYDQKIKAAKKAGKDTTKLEEEKEEAINAVKKKYADKQFKATVLQVIATTAVSAMEAYKSMAGIPIVGPVLGAIAAAATIAAGAVQIANAKQARDEAKGLKEGGYSKDYVEGYTTSGNPDDVAGVIPVHKNEFVGNHEGVANPHVKQFYDVFDMAQKNGSIRMINTTQILEQVRTRSGKYSGGYTQEDSTGKAPSFGFSSFGGNADDANLKTVIMLLTESNRILNVIADKDLVVDSREVRKGLQKLDKLEANVSRK